MRRLPRSLVIAFVALVVLSPLARDPRSDSYPLSTYPMFATNRGAEHDISTVVELMPDGATVRLAPELIAGTDELVLAAATVRRAVRDGMASELCDEVVARLGPARRARVQTERHDVVALVADDAPPLAIEVHAECGNG